MRAQYAFVQTYQHIRLRHSAFFLTPTELKQTLNHARTDMHTLINKHTSMLKEAQQHPQLNLKVRTTTNVHYFVMQLKRHKYCLCKYLYFYYFLF